jgi:hypothetical protein
VSDSRGQTAAKQANAVQAAAFLFGFMVLKA